MKSWLKSFYGETDIGYGLLGPFVRARDGFLRGAWRSDRSRISRDFLRVFGRPMDWDHPRTLNEKLNWMKRNVRDPLQRIAADKYAVRAFVADKIGQEHLIPLIKTYSRASDIRLAELPRAFALKVNHGSGQNWLVRDKALEDERRIRRQFREWMRTSHYAISCEWPYKGIRPLIVAEELLTDGNGCIPEDYKIHCFGGKAAFIQVDLDRETDHRRNFYDLQWRLQPFLWTEWTPDGRPAWPNGAEVPRPAALEEMIRIAETLAAGFPYVRIDLFYCGGKVYFGEITFYHGGGLERFSPDSRDLEFGALLTLPVAPRGPMKNG